MNSIKHTLIIQPSTHCSDAHFPGNPITPGAYLLALINQKIQQSSPDYRVCEISKVKFIAPTPPNSSATLKLEYRSATNLTFELSNNMTVLLSGKASLEPLT